jgi:hypothetical protein
MKYGIRFDTLGAAVMTPLGAGRKHSSITVDDTRVEVRLGWAFTGTIPRSSITSVARRDGSVISRGAHGWSGRWLVNGAGNGLVVVTIDPPAHARVAGVPVRLRELTVSADDPDQLVAALTMVD